MNLHLHLQALLVGLLARCVPHGVVHNARVAVALLVVVGHHAVEVFLEVALHIARFLPEHLLPEAQLLGEIHVARLLHLAGQRQVAHLAVAVEDKRVNLDLLAALHIEYHRQAAIAVCSARGGHRHPREALVDVVSFNLVGRGAQQVLGHHIAGDHLDLLAQLLVFAFLHPREAELVQPRALLEHYLQEGYVALQACHADLHILEHALLPQILYRA